MIIDFLLSPLLTAIRAAVQQLPTGHALALPDLSPMWAQVRGFDSLVPVMAPLGVLLGLLSAGVVFIVVRLAIAVWHLIWP